MAEDTIAEAYNQAEQSTEMDWGRIVYEVPHGQKWQEASGYITGDLDTFITVITEDSIKKIPADRLIYEEYKND